MRRSLALAGFVGICCFAVVFLSQNNTTTLVEKSDEEIHASRAHEEALKALQQVVKAKHVLQQEQNVRLTKIQRLKLKLKALFRSQRRRENAALGVRREAMRQWAEYKYDLDEAEKNAKQSARFSHTIMQYANKAVKAKKKEQVWARKAFKDLRKALTEESKHPERIREAREMTRREQNRAAADPDSNFQLDPLFEHHRPLTAMEKAENQLEKRVFDGVATRSEIRAYHELNRMKHWLGKKKENTFMGEALEIVRKKHYGHKFKEFVDDATGHAKLANKYTKMSSKIVNKAALYTKLENKVMSKLNALRKTPPDLQRVRKVIVQLVDPPPPPPPQKSKAKTTKN